MPDLEGKSPLRIQFFSAPCFPEASAYAPEQAQVMPTYLIGGSECNPIKSARSMAFRIVVWAVG